MKTYKQSRTLFLVQVTFTFTIDYVFIIIYSLNPNVDSPGNGTQPNIYSTPRKRVQKLRQHNSLFPLL